MREIRIIELEHGEPVETWWLAQPMQLHVSHGELWLTIAGDTDDYWLRAGESVDLRAGARMHVSAGRAGARFMLALGSTEAAAAPVAAGAMVGDLHAAGVRGFIARVGEALHTWAQRAQWGARAAG